MGDFPACHFERAETYSAPDQPAICSHLFGQLASPQSSLELVPQAEGRRKSTRQESNTQKNTHRASDFMPKHQQNMEDIGTLYHLSII